MAKMRYEKVVTAKGVVDIFNRHSTRGEYIRTSQIPTEPPPPALPSAKITFNGGWAGWGRFE